MINWAREIKMQTLMRWNGLNDFSAKIGLTFSSRQYTVKTAETMEEVKECCRLRHKVFFREKNDWLSESVDVDRYDYYFDHLMIIHKETKTLIGTYRLGLYSENNSYTSSEFNLSPLINYPGPYLELGRACVDRNHRNGSVITLLFKGIIEYMNISGAETLFGCSSISTLSAVSAAKFLQYFQIKGQCSDSVLFRPVRDFSNHEYDNLAKLSSGFTADELDQIENELPSLIKSYLKMGAVIGSHPAFDTKFECIDFLTILRKSDINDSFARRLQLIQ